MLNLFYSSNEFITQYVYLKMVGDGGRRVGWGEGQGRRTFNVTSGSADLTFTCGMDPAQPVERSIATMSAARSLIGIHQY